MNKALVIGAGSCIVEAIVRHLQAVPGLDAKADLHLSQILADGRAPIPEDLLSRCGILIEEAAPWQNRGTLSDEEKALLPEACITVSVPTLHFNSLWPLMTEDPRSMPGLGTPSGRIPFPMGDRLALKIVQTVPDPSGRRRAYDATELATVANLGRSHELEIRNCFAREQGCDVRVAAYVMSHFRDKRLYYTHNHPTGELMYFVLAQLFAVPAIRDLIKLPYDQLVTSARVWVDTSNVFVGEEAPIHPAVAEHFQLKWWRRDHRYRWQHVNRTFDQWIDWYLECTPAAATTHAKAQATEPSPPADLEAGETIAIDAFLATPGLQQQLQFGHVLCAATEVERTPLFFETAVDAAVAEHGDIMHREETRRYQSPEAVCGSLRNAAVIGSNGLVMYEGRILGDTFRHLRVGADAPAIAATFPDRLVLQPTVARQATQIRGTHFCGFSGGWRDYAIWLTTTLPRLVAYKRLLGRRPDVRLVLPCLPEKSFQAETLAILGVEPADVTEIGDSARLAFGELFVTSAFDLWSVSPFCREAARHLTTAALAGNAPPNDSPERLYIYDWRSLETMSNFHAVATVLSQHGFHCMSLDDLPLREQIAIMQKARFIVGDHGPSLANLLFAQPGTRVLELFKPRDPQPMYWSIASVSGQSYGFVVGSPVNADAPRGSPGSFEIPVQLLKDAIKAMLSATG